MSNPVIEIRGIEKYYEGIRVLGPVNLSIRPGEVHCLAGVNGSGKSTLIKVISGVIAPEAGDVLVGGEPLTLGRPRESIRAGVQVIYQDALVFPNLTVAENIALYDWLDTGKKFVRPRDAISTAKAALDLIGITMDLSAIGEDLSVADRQLVAISRAIQRDAKFIIMDEPTTALTRKEVDGLLRVIRTLKTAGVAVLFVSHKLAEVLDVCEKVTVLRDGQIVSEGPADAYNTSTLSHAMTGRDIAPDPYRPTDLASRPTVVEVTDLVRAGTDAQVSFTISAGEIVGLVGLLGSGRTELATTLFGLRPIDSGSIVIDGAPVRVRHSKDAIAAGIAYVPEDRAVQGVFSGQSIAKNIVASSIGRIGSRLGLLAPRTVDGVARTWIERLSIKTPHESLAIEKLSGGNQQRVLLARWLATSPRFLILDGPTVGVDVGSKEEIHQLIRSLAAEGIAILIISDDLEEIVDNSSRVLIMRDGRIVSDAPADQLDVLQLESALVAA
ncbi:sugar ABC transporter ATP-binding protein [Microbacterium aerolatum]|uniref:Lipase n=1 Tax=Microbacterium aerolatum TaxID=153731 RepID=A0A511AE70_9MICO|nr:sugar ABC transporter ATP-binding protein [Microbacterium aerolatum]GEK85683.1 lipase [Microbacterium aerolatum]GGB21210.1 lipase [Microbacterium aerolatum]